MKKYFPKENDSFPAFVIKKRLGQNFLVDRKVLARIVEACQLDPSETVLEIGPGQGALTREILPFVKEVVAVEADRQLADGLLREFAQQPLTVHHADFLKFDLSKIPSPIKALGNLPYYISTPIITHVLENRQSFTALFMTVQREFGERLVAPVGSKEYSSFSCFVNYFAKPHILFRIKPQAFRPVPKVESCFMRLDIRSHPAVTVRNEPLFLNVIRQAFQQRRKTILNSMSGICPKADLGVVLRSAGVPERSRAEDLTLEDYGRIADSLEGRYDR